MKIKKLLITILVMLLATVCFAAYPITYRNVNNPRLLTRMLQDRIGTIDDQIVTLQAASTSGIYENLGTGDVFYVDSATGSDTDTGLTWALAKATLDAAVALCTDGNHDVIYVASGHAETLAADVTLDIDDVTVIGIGSGVDMPEFTFDTTTDEFIVDAQGVTVYNLRFLAGIADVATGFDLQDESDYCSIIACEFPEPATATHEFTTVIALTTGADNVTIAYNTFINQAATPGNSYFVDCGAAAIDSLTIVGNHVNADSAGALIFSDKADTNLIIANNTLIQEDQDKLCIELSSTATGLISNNMLCNLGGTSYLLDPGSCHLDRNRANIAIDSASFIFPLEPAEGRTTGTGSIFYVDNGAANAGDGRSWNTAVAKLDTAINLCTADAGDTIYIAAGHTETDGDADIDRNNITIIGLGSGKSIPYFHHDTTTDVVLVNADNIKIKNCRFSAGAATVDEAINIETGAENCVIEDCIFDAVTINTHYFDNAIVVDAASHNVTLKNCRFYQGSGSAVSAFKFLNADYTQIIGNQFFGDYSTAPIYNLTTASIQITIKDNIIFNGTTGGGTGLNTEPAIELKDDTTGMILNNTIACNETTPDVSIVAPDCFLAGNTYTETESTGGSVAVGQSRVHTYLVDTLGLLGTGGKIVYCDSGETTGVEDGLTWETAADTLEEAIQLCSASVGDVILIAPGHAETLTAEDIDFDIIGVSAIGLGNGSLRPTFTFDNASAEIAIGVDNIRLEKLIFLTSKPTVAIGIDIEDNADYTTIKDCLFAEVGDDTGNDEFNDAIKIGNACIGTMIDGCIFRAEAAAAMTAISSDDDTAFTTIQNCRIMGDYSVACIEFASVASTDLWILDNILVNGDLVGDNGLNAVEAINIVDASGGLIARNYIASDVATGLLMRVADDMTFMDNKVTDTDGDDHTSGDESAAAGISTFADG